MGSAEPIAARRRVARCDETDDVARWPEIAVVPIVRSGARCLAARGDFRAETLCGGSVN